MVEENLNTCKTVALKPDLRVNKVECVGPQFLQYLSQSGLDAEGRIISFQNDKDDIADDVYEDNVNYLRSLDPTKWKEQDHYAVLGLKNFRYKATDDDIKKAYRKKVLKHHPDKRKGLGEEIRPDDDYFTCITKAYEILGTSAKRKSYDSVDPEFDDSLPSGGELKKDFFETFTKYFELNSRWSEKKYVPKLGDENTSRDEVEKFYSFWYNFDSWREFSYLDEEEKEKGQDREERRWIEKQNKAARAKRKKEEMSRIRNLVDLSYNTDPRIAKFKMEDKEKKEAVKRAKQDAVQARREEEERALKEIQEAKEKAEAAERALIEAKRQERELQKKALKKERKTFRDICKSNDYFGSDSAESVSHMTAVDKICEVLKLTELEQINKELVDEGKLAFLKIVKQTEEKLEAERKAMFQKYSSKTDGVSDKSKSGPANWTPDNIQLLIKAVNLFPAGTNQRWEVVANFINQHGNVLNGKYSAKDVLAKAKDLQKSDFSKSNLKTDVNKQAYNNFEKNTKNARVFDEVNISKKEDILSQNTLNSNSANITSEQLNVNGDCKTTGIQKKPESTPWTPAEQKLLEQALKTYPSSTEERWDKISDCIPNRSKKECMRRYKELVDLVKAKKAAQAAVK